MINICICTDQWLEEYTGGIDRIINFAKHISKQGQNVYLIDRSLKKAIHTLFIDGDKYYKVENGILKEQYYPFYIRFLIPGLIKFFQEILNRGASLLTRTPEFMLFYTINPYLIVKLIFVCKKENIDLIQCEFHTTTLSSFVVKKLLSIPLIYDAHNIETERIRSAKKVSKFYITMTKLIEKISLNICDLIYVVSKNDKNKLLSWNIPNTKIKIIPNSVEIDKFSTDINGSKIRNKYGLYKNIIIIFHGTLNYPPNEEAVNILINNIFPHIIKKYPSVHIMLVGKNPPKISHPNIIVTGFVKNLQEYIAAANIAVVPLLRGGGTKIKLVEYMACGKAIVSTMKGAEGLSLQNGQDILISKYPNSIFINLILKLMKNDVFRKNLGINARKKAELYYDWKKNAKKAINFYNDLKFKYDKYK